jgi:hypothetical protein
MLAERLFHADSWLVLLMIAAFAGVCASVGLRIERALEQRRATN